jgi:hypothetical protein
VRQESIQSFPDIRKAKPEKNTLFRDVCPSQHYEYVPELKQLGRMQWCSLTERLSRVGGSGVPFNQHLGG